MKSFSSILLLFLFLQSNAATGPYRVQGKLTGKAKAKYAYLQIFMVKPDLKGGLVKTSIKDNQFLFDGNIEFSPREDRTARIFISDNPNLVLKDVSNFMKQSDNDTRLILLERDIKIEITESVRSAKITGSKDMEILNEHQLLEVEGKLKFDEITKKYKKLEKEASGDKEKLMKISGERMNDYIAYQDALFMKRLAIIRKYPESTQNVSWLVLLSRVGIDYKGGFLAKEIEAVWKDVAPSMKNHPDSKKITENIKVAHEKAALLGPGSLIPEHTFHYEGGKISTADLRGKYVLLDFWTSWCGPCRAQHYDIKQAYEKYKGRGFDILQVSLDNKKEPWLKALKEDGLPWQNLRNETGWDDEMKKIFNLQSVPANYLIGPDGKIIAKNVTGKQLNEELERVIK